jgi:hypothetical protein
MLLLDPDGPSDQTPTVLTEQYINPFAFVVTADGELWVADNAVGDDVERIGRGDLADRSTHLPSPDDGRAPAAMVELADGRLGICGFLDGQMLAYTRRDADDPAAVEPATDGSRLPADATPPITMPSDEPTTDATAAAVPRLDGPTTDAAPPITMPSDGPTTDATATAGAPTDATQPETTDATPSDATHAGTASPADSTTWSSAGTDSAGRTIAESTEMIGPCQTGAAVLDTGDIVTVTEGTFTLIPAP